MYLPGTINVTLFTTQGKQVDLVHLNVCVHFHHQMIIQIIHRQVNLGNNLLKCILCIYLAYINLFYFDYVQHVCV